MAQTQAMPQEKPIKVMIVVTSHMANPGHNLHDVDVVDVLTPERQKELISITSKLNRFHPTKIAVESETKKFLDRLNEQATALITQIQTIHQVLS